MRRKKVLEKLKISFGQVKDDDFDFELIEKYFRNRNHSEDFHVLSDKSCNDLDFNDLFMFVDRTTSKPGQQYLYNRLRTVAATSPETDLEEEIIDKFANDENFRLNTQYPLSKLGREDVYYIPSLFQEEHTPPPKWFFMVPVLSFTSLLCLILIPFNSFMALILLGVFLINIIIHYWNKRNLYQYLGSIPQLLRLNSIAATFHKQEIFRRLAPDLGNSIRIIARVRNRMSFFQLETKVQGEMEALVWAILEIIKIAFLLEPLLLFSVLKQLDTKRKEIEEVFSFTGRVDSLISIASLRKGSECCIPEISEERMEIRFEQISHPLIFNCVSNDIHLVDKSVLLTGSNMSGKTSFIRTIGINIITGLTINTCFAQSAIIPRTRIFSAIRISDDLLNDRSYYFEEVLTIKEMIEESGREKPNLFLLDEIFKGTNTVERISAGKAVLSMLSKGNNRVFVSSHDIELTELLNDEYDLYHFSEIVKDRNVDFDYILKEGKLKNRNAIRILQINDYPQALVEEAVKISEMMDNSGKTKLL